MARKVSTETRQDLLQAIRERYQSGTKDVKVRILDEFIAVTGYHRKHVIRLFKARRVAKGGIIPHARLPVYDAAVREAIVVLWEASDRVCGKRLKPLLPILVTALERHGHLALDATVRARVLSASAATLDRLLRPTRASVSGERARRRAMPAVQRNVPVRTRSDAGAARRKSGAQSPPRCEGTLMRRSAPIAQRLPAAFVKLIEPLVAGLAADVVPRAQFRHRVEAELPVADESFTLFHGCGLQPGHSPTSVGPQRKVSPMFPV